MVDWLSNRQSLTLRLTDCCGQFRVQRLQQEVARCLPDECAAIGLSKPGRVMARDVLLRCDERAVVYAHTVLPWSANVCQWPLFAALGNKSLGSILFNDPLVQRDDLQFARLRRPHPLMQRIAKLNLLPAQTSCLYARRCLFTRHGSPLLVTEVFLPAIHPLRNKPTQCC
jgi:chorismate--pyruvate lyase